MAGYFGTSRPAAQHIQAAVALHRFGPARARRALSGPGISGHEIYRRFLSCEDQEKARPNARSWKGSPCLRQFHHVAGDHAVSPNTGHWRTESNLDNFSSDKVGFSLYISFFFFSHIHALSSFIRCSGDWSFVYPPPVTWRWICGMHKPSPRII